MTNEGTQECDPAADSPQRPHLELPFDRGSAAGEGEWKAKALADVYGMTPEDVVGKMQRDITPVRDEEDHFLEDDCKVWRSGKRLVIPEEVYTDPSGEEHILRTVKIPFRAANTDEPAVLGICEDITDCKRVEKEIERAHKLEAVGVLAGGIAHDFNNLLTAILGNVDLALNSMRTGQADREVLEEAREASLRARDLANQLLTFSKGGAPVRERADLAPCIRDTVRFTLRGSNIAVDVDLPEDLWQVEIDSGQISQVVHNLVINAVQAMPEGGELKVRGRNLEGVETGMPLGEGRHVLVTFTDTGAGISQEIIDRVFDPYFTTKDAGSGLGLATCYAIMQKHEGNIWVESSARSGTTAYLGLPAVTGPSAGEEIESGALKDDGADASGRILIMDDQEPVRRIAGRMLERAGFDVDGAGDGKEAEELCRAALDERRPYDVAVLDLTIPGGKDGLQTLKALRALDPNVAAIVSSGYANSPVLSDYRNHGFDGFVAKPYEARDLVTEVRRVLGGG